MQIGFNFTTNGTLDMVQRMIQERQIDYCELLIDNFLHVPPKELIDAFECPVGFHIMRSQHLERDRETLEKLAKRIRFLIEAINPVYVSDHLLRFTNDGRNFHFLGEIDYKKYDAIRVRVEQWQEMLGTHLYLENYPSIMEGGWDARPSISASAERRAQASFSTLRTPSAPCTIAARRSIYGKTS